MRTFLVFIFAVVLSTVSLFGQNWNSIVNKQFIKDIGQTIDSTMWFVSDYGMLSFDGINWHSYPIYNITNGHTLNSIYTSGSEVWIATNGGAVLFDGNASYLYDINSTFGGLGNDEIMAITKDQTGRIWFGTSDGIYVFDGSSWSNFNSEIYTEILSLCFDSQNRMWVGTDIGLACYNSTSWNVYTSVNSGLINDFVTEIHEDASGNLWFGTPQGLSFFNGVNWVDFDQSDGLPSSIITGIDSDASGNLWVSTNNGLAKFDYSVWTTFNSGIISFLQNEINSVFCDSSDKLWLAADTGISLYSSGLWMNYPSIPISSIQGLETDSQHNMWILSGGLYKYNQSSFTQIPNLPFANNYSIHVDPLDKVWFTGITGPVSWNGTQWYLDIYNTSPLEFNDPLCISSDINGDICFGTNNFGVTHTDSINELTSWWYFNDNSGLLSEIVFSIFWDRNNNTIWAGTLQGLASIDSNNIVTDHRSDYNLGNASIYCINGDSFGNIWVGTYGSGLIKYDGSTWTVYNTSNGLASNYILDIAFEDDSIIWIGTANGASRFDGNSFINYSITDGLVSNVVYHVAIDSSDTKWFGTANGISLFHEYVMPTTLNLDIGAKSTASFEIKDLNNWQVTQSESWINVDITSGTTDAVITITAAPNDSIVRSGVITVFDNDLNFREIVHVIQEGSHVSIQEKFPESVFTVFPNPIANEIHLYISEPAMVFMYNTTGSIVKSWLADNNSVQSIAELPSGIYYLSCLKINKVLKIVKL